MSKLSAAQYRSCFVGSRRSARIPGAAEVRFHPVSFSSQPALRKSPRREDWVQRKLSRAVPLDRDS